MHEDGVLNRAKGRGMGTVVGSQYSAKDFQLEVLDRLAEVQDFAASLEQSWEKKLEAVKEQRLLKFDSRAARPDTLQGSTSFALDAESRRGSCHHAWAPWVTSPD